jgi:hypothetical protein
MEKEKIMSDKEINLARADEVFLELFNENKEIIHSFENKFPKELLDFAENFSFAWKKYMELNRLLENSSNKQRGFVLGWVYLLLENLFTSTKLFIQGHSVPSGNLMRQVIEGIAMAILCSLDEKIEIYSQKKRKWVEANFYESFRKDKPDAITSKALWYLDKNKKKLNLKKEGLEILYKVRKHNHQYSHPSQLSLGATIWFGSPPKLFFGGGFDEEKIREYKIDLDIRTGLCKQLPAVIDWLIVKVKKLPTK